MGNPQMRLPPVVQVAGTNGKGSTIAFLRAMLEAAGYRVHAYTSPHLHRFEERIRLAGELIAERALFRALESARAACGDDLAVTFFEGTTAAAYLAMASTPADIALIETGMGGRMDPTNLLPTAIASIITPVGLDHTEFLGPTLADIAHHKAGIVHRGVPLILGPQAVQVQEIMIAAADAAGAPVLQHGRDWACECHPEGLVFEDTHGQALLPFPALSGAHQAINAGMAIATLTALADFTVNEEAVCQGLVRVEWPGRLERLHEGPLAAQLPLGWEVWMDGGHNAQGAHAIAAHIATAWKDRPVHLIFGTTQGKDLESMLAPLLPLVESAWAVPVRAEPKSYAPESIVQDAFLPMKCATSAQEAVSRCVAAHTAPARILIFGSLYLRVECR